MVEERGELRVHYQETSDLGDSLRCTGFSLKKDEKARLD